MFITFCLSSKEEFYHLGEFHAEELFQSRLLHTGTFQFAGKVILLPKTFGYAVIASALYPSTIIKEYHHNQQQAPGQADKSKKQVLVHHHSFNSFRQRKRKRKGKTLQFVLGIVHFIPNCRDIITFNSFYHGRTVVFLSKEGNSRIY